MTESQKHRRVWQKPEPHPKVLRSLLVPIDLTPISDRVLARITHLPLSEGARVTLLHVVPDTLPTRARSNAARDARQLLDDEASSLAKLVPKNVKIAAVVKIGAAMREIARCARATKADLIVMGRGGGRVLRDIFLGSTAERVIRRLTLPVLVVRLAARGPYRRPALALDLDRASHDVLAMTLRVLPPPRPAVTVIHAYDIPYERLVYPSLPKEDAQQLRGDLHEKATRQLANLLAAFLARAHVRPSDVPRWKTHIRQGSARLVIQKAVKHAHADLLVLGTRGFTGVAHLFLGTVAGDVLRDVACDVLVVPPHRRRR